MTTLAKILYFKSREWAHEKEVRFLVPLAKAEDSGQTDSLGCAVRIVPIPGKAVSYVIHGPKTPQRMIEYAQRILCSGMCSTRELHTFRRQPGDYGSVLVGSEADAARAARSKGSARSWQ